MGRQNSYVFHCHFVFLLLNYCFIYVFIYFGVCVGRHAHMCSHTTAHTHMYDFRCPQSPEEEGIRSARGNVQRLVNNQICALEWNSVL